MKDVSYRENAMASEGNVFYMICNCWYDSGAGPKWICEIKPIFYYI